MNVESISATNRDANSFIVTLSLRGDDRHDSVKSASFTVQLDRAGIWTLAEIQQKCVQALLEDLAPLADFLKKARAHDDEQLRRLLQAPPAAEPAPAPPSTPE